MSSEFGCEPEEPVHVFVLVDIAVVLLEVLRLRWRGEDEVDGFVGQRGQEWFGSAAISSPQSGLEMQLRERGRIRLGLLTEFVTGFHGLTMRQPAMVSNGRMARSGERFA